jgi:hypothetical protein
MNARVICLEAHTGNYVLQIIAQGEQLLDRAKMIRNEIEDRLWGLEVERCNADQLVSPRAVISIHSAS